MRQNRWDRITNLRPLESRTFRFKNPVLEFFCPLCRTKRAMTTHHKLSFLNYIQIFAISAVLIILSWGAMEWRAFFWFFLVWTAFEGTRRILWRKEIPCPHCGFDASWYKTDVKMARQKVQEFWNKRSDEGLTLENPEEANGDNPVDYSIVMPGENGQSEQDLEHNPFGL